MVQKKSPLTAAGIAVAIIGSIWATQLKSDVKPGALLLADNANVVANGLKIYTDNCASCHSADLKGEANWRSPNTEGLMPAPPHDKSGHTWHHTDDVLFEITKKGIAVLSYIKSTWPKNIQDRHDQMNEQKAKTTN